MAIRLVHHSAPCIPRQLQMRDLRFRLRPVTNNLNDDVVRTRSRMGYYELILLIILL